jgi:TRAP-type mannitol/chloroaromatic compound transport system permease small subunit
VKNIMKIAGWIDLINIGVGKISIWMIFAATAISAGNALVRYIFGVGSNAFLEIQWYLFAAVFMLGAGYGFLHNVHVRIDVVASRLSDRTRNWIDVGGVIVFLLPFCAMMIYMGIPLLERAYVSGETSFSPGGLIRWPIYALIPVGFSLLALQGLSELAKRINYLFFDGVDVLNYEHEANQKRDKIEAQARDAA